MSSELPTPDASANGTTGASEASAPDTGSASAQKISEGDFRERAMQDPDFAWKQVQTHQSRADTLQAESQKATKELQTFKEGLGNYANDDPANIALHLDQIVMPVKNNPAVQKAFQDAVAGKETPSGGNEVDDEEYLSDEQKELREVKAQLTAVNSRLGQQESSAGAQALGEHLKSVLTNWDAGPEASKRVTEGLRNYVHGLAAQGEVGIKALHNLQDPKHGPSTVKALVLGMMTDEEHVQAVHNRDLRRQGKLSGMATDGQSSGASSGDEMPPEFESSLDTLNYAMEHPEKMKAIYGE